MDFYQDNLFKSLLKELLAEPYAQSSVFNLKTLETVSKQILKDSQTLQKEDPHFQSFERSKALLVLLLTHLELAGIQEFPKGMMTPFFGTEFSDAPPSSLKVASHRFFQHLKLTGQFPGSPVELDKLIGLELCLELESECLRLLENLSATPKGFILEVRSSCFFKTNWGWEPLPSFAKFLEAAASRLEVPKAELWYFSLDCIEPSLRPRLRNLSSINSVVAHLLVHQFVKSESVISDDSFERLVTELCSVEKQKREALSSSQTLATTWLSKLENSYQQCRELLATLNHGGLGLQKAA